jgi:hypothetical protein
MVLLLLTMVIASVSCPSGYYYSSGYCYRNSSWYGWGRWLFAGIVVLFVIACFVLIG